MTNNRLNKIKDYQDAHQEEVDADVLDSLIYKNLSKDDLFEDVISTIED